MIRPCDTCRMESDMQPGANWCRFCGMTTNVPEFTIYNVPVVDGDDFDKPEPKPKKKGKR